MNMGFVILYVDDMEKTKAFYTNVLGMDVVEAVSSPDFVTLRPSGGSLVALQAKSAAQFPPMHETRPGTVELSFEVENVDETWQHWKQNGATMLSEPQDLPFGRYFIAQDPEGHYLSAYRFARRAAPPTN